MLRQGVAKPQQPPRTMTRSETFPLAAMMAGVGGRVRQASESEPEDYVPPPPTQSIGDALASALQRATVAEEPSPAAAANGGGGGGGKGRKGKKSKGKKIDLFGAARPML